ncbi:hypothetical protein THAOC_33542 [Thalassiosira oceanica]|uniref:Uncharacterized protein n=1 Tax=Thalassiosira oceanica TaxID=159749 RepID=K0RLZ4_THAOC|nr:hypothetical protein THAOC_33542 [Thalassiosira oceanica]|eukprot:EJK47722.1 hypothetical protein THAOC_33542 [Thalassiosira oceanica]
MTAKRLFCAIASLLLLIAAAETIRGVTFEANSDSVGSPLTTLDEEQVDPVDPGPAADPQLTDCLLSAVKEEDCGSLVKGCYWCAEPGEENSILSTLKSRVPGLQQLNTNVAREKSTVCA